MINAKKTLVLLSLTMVGFQGFTLPSFAEVVAETAEKLPDLKSLVDSNSPFGLNLENVYKRQKLMRESGHLVGTDPCVSIINIQSLKDKLKTYYEITVPFEVSIKGLEADVDNKKINKTKAKKAKKKLEADQAEQLKLAFGSMERYKTPEAINPEIRRLETLVVKDLGTYGLTLEQIKALPSLKSSRSKSKVWPLS